MKMSFGSEFVVLRNERIVKIDGQDKTKQSYHIIFNRTVTC